MRRKCEVRQISGIAANPIWLRHFWPCAGLRDARGGAVDARCNSSVL